MADITMSYTTADGSSFSATGWIHIESRETEDYKASLELHPRTDWTSLGGANQDVSGTMKKLTLDGITYDVLPDSNFSESVAKFKNETVPTSGRTLRKMTRQAPIVKSVTIACNQIERDRLKALAETA
jgi:hypothetical protein